MTYERFEQAREVYEKLNEMMSLATFFNKGEFNDTRDMEIGVFGKDLTIVNRIYIPNEIREKINFMLWEEVHKIEEEFKEI